MGQATDGVLPFDALGYRADGVYVPGLGTVAAQGSNAATDATGTNYAAQVVTTSAASTTSISAANTGLPVNLPVIVQKTSAASTGSVATLAKAFAGANVAGNSIVVVAGCGNGTAMTVADSAGNTYYSAVQAANSTTFEAQIFYATNILAGANTVTVTNAGTTASMALELYEVSGLIAQAGNVLDQSVTATGTSATPSATNIAASSPNELAFMGIAVGTAAQAASVTAGTFWTLDSTQNTTTPSGLYSFGAFSQPLGTTTAVAPKATIAGSEPFALAAATFRGVSLPVQGVLTLAGYNYTHITTDTTTLVKSGPGILHSIIINTHGASATIEFDDALTHASPVMGIITCPSTITSAIPIALEYDVQFSTGLSITTGTATLDITVVWK